MLSFDVIEGFGNMIVCSFAEHGLRIILLNLGSRLLFFKVVGRLCNERLK